MLAPRTLRLLEHPEAWSDDRELVDAIVDGSREHFDLLYKAYFPRVYCFARKRLSDAGEAEDVTQEVFMTVFRVLPSFQGDSTLLTWIFGITRNTVNRRFRRQRARLEPLDGGGGADGICDDSAPPDRAADARRILDRCEQVIARDLTPLQRRIFHLKHLRRQPIRSIAEALGTSEDAVKASLYRMRKALLKASPDLELLLSSGAPPPARRCAR